MPKFYVLCCLFVLLATSFTQAESVYYMTEARSVIPIRVVDKLVLVEAEVDGLRGNFLFDTGIGSLALNDRYFGNEEENLQKFRKVVDVNGSREKLEGCFVRAFSWGGVQRDSFLAPLVDLSNLEKVFECKLLGLLGWEVFLDLEIYVDFDGGFMTLCRLDESGLPQAADYSRAPDHRLSFSLEGHLPVLTARIGDCSLHLGFDTGASINIINKKLRGDLPPDARRLMRIPYGGVFSQTRAPFIAVDAIFVDGQFAVFGWRMAATSVRHFERKGIDIDGLIGADLFRLGRVAINYRKQEISIWVNDNIFSKRYQAVDGQDLARKARAVASPQK